MAKEKDTAKLSYRDIADYILDNRATKDFEVIGAREEFLQKLEETKKRQEAKSQKKKAAAKEGEEPPLEQPKNKEREEKSPEQMYDDRVRTKSDDIRAKFASHKDDPKFKAYVLELCRDDKLKDILYPGWQKEAGAAPAFPSREEILRQFENKEAHHHYFNTDGARKEAHEQYVRSFLLAKFVDDCIERPGRQQEDSMAHEMAYKMTIFWRGDLKAVDAYLKSSNYYATNQALHDSLASTAIAADGTQVTLDAWRHLILTTKDAKAVLDNFGNADRIEEKLGKPPTNISEIQETATKLLYARAQEKPEMAVVFRKYKVSEEIFNRCLEIDARKKRKDNLPDVRINGADLDHPGYHLVKLPVDDPRAYILGKITSCCQSIGDHSERCVIDGVTRDNNGFYVLLKGKEGANPLFEDGKINYRDFDIVGQGYAWKTQAGNICFDSWENDGIEGDSKRESSDKVILTFLDAYAKEVCEHHGVDRVSIGCGGKTPQVYHGQKESSEGILEGGLYGDANVQAEIGTSSGLLAAREKLLQFTPGKPVNQFVSVKSIEAFRVLPKELIEQLWYNSNYTLLTGPLMFPETDANEFYQAILRNQEKMAYLTSDPATRAYQTGAVKASDLMYLDPYQIRVLISNDAIRAYATGAMKASDLRGLDLPRIEALTSPLATKAYKIGAATSSDLKDLDLDKIKALTSDAAIAAYQTGAVTASDLKDRPLEQIEVLISYAAITAYGTGKAKVRELLSDKVTEIYINILQKISQHYCNEPVRISEEIDHNKIQALTSGYAIYVYKEGLVKASDLMELNPDQIKALTSDIAIEAYRIKGVKVTDLLSDTPTGIHIKILQKISQHYCNESVRISEEIDYKKIEALASYYAIKAYLTKELRVSDLMQLDLEQIYALTSPDAVRAYQKGEVKASYLIGLDSEVIKALTSDAAIALYRTEGVKASELIGLDSEAIKALTSLDAARAYQTKLVQARELIAFDSEAIKALTSDAAIESYRTEGVKASELRGLDLPKIKALISYDAARAYKTREVTAIGLRGFDLEQIEVLTSPWATKAYTTRVMKTEDLLSTPITEIPIKLLQAISQRYCDESVIIPEEIDSNKIQSLTSSRAIEAYETKAVKVSDLIGLDLGKIQILTLLPNVIEAYKTKAVQASDLIGLDFGKIQALTSPNAIAAYKTKAVKASDLIGLDFGKIQALTSPNAIAAYKTKAVQASDLIDLDFGKIQALTSPNAIAAYQTEAVEASDLVNLDPDRLRLLISDDAIAAYETKAVTASDLKDLDLARIEALTSPWVIEAYRTKGVTASDLKDLDLARIQALTDYAATETYKTGLVKVGDLRSDTVKGIHIKILKNISKYCYGEDIRIPEEIDPKKIQGLTSQVACIAYRTGGMTPRHWIDLDIKKIEVMLDDFATEAYRLEAATPSDFINLDLEKIEALTDYQVFKAYQTKAVKASDLVNLDPDRLRLLTSDAAIAAYETKAVKASDLNGDRPSTERLPEFFQEVIDKYRSGETIDLQSMLASEKYASSHAARLETRRDKGFGGHGRE